MAKKQRLLFVSLVSMIFGFLLASIGWTYFYRITNCYYDIDTETLRVIFLISSGSYTVIAFVYSVIAALYLSKSHPHLTWVPAVVCFFAQALVFEIRGMPMSWMAPLILIFNVPALIGGFLPMMVMGVKFMIFSPKR